VATQEGPYAKRTARWTVAGVCLTFLIAYLALASGKHWFPFGSPGASAAASSISTTTSPSLGPTPTLTPSPSPRARTVAYLDKMAPTSGGPVGRGVASINGQSFSQSIWLPFAESCCGSAQSVTYSVPSGYRQFTGVLGEEEAGGLSSGYTVLFSVTVNGLQVVDNRQVLLGDPPVHFSVSLPAGSATIEIDVTADCPNIYCVGNAVVGNARVLPLGSAAQ